MQFAGGHNEALEEGIFLPAYLLKDPDFPSIYSQLWKDKHNKWETIV